MNRFAAPLLTALITLPWAAPAAANCRAEAAVTVAEIRATSSDVHSAEAIALARDAALAMCERLLTNMPSAPAADTAPRQPVVDKNKDSLFGIPIGSSDRSAGHKRLQRR